MSASHTELVTASFLALTATGTIAAQGRGKS